MEVDRMSTEKQSESVRDSETTVIAPQSGDELSPPPATNGWQQFEVPADETGIVEYWRKGSTHVAATYECVRVSQSYDEMIRVTSIAYDRFGNQKSQTSHTKRDPEQVDWAWDAVTKVMDRHCGQGDITTRPSKPETIGNWELVVNEYDHYGWEHTDFPATIEFVESEMKSGYAASTRFFTLKYDGVGDAEWDIAEDILLTEAFEIVVHACSTLTRPVVGHQNRLDRLSELSGIGPSRSRKLVSLGVTGKQDIQNCENASNTDRRDNPTHPVNRFHTEAVTKRITSATLTE
jgi:hypothetical protein